MVLRLIIDNTLAALSFRQYSYFKKIAVINSCDLLVIQDKRNGDYLVFYSGKIQVSIKDNSKNKYTVTL